MVLYLEFILMNNVKSSKTALHYAGISDEGIRKHKGN
jgi:hypothetical protein